MSTDPQDRYEELRDQLLDVTGTDDPGSEMEPPHQKDFKPGGEHYDDPGMETDDTSTAALVSAWTGDRDTLDVALNSTSKEHHPELLRAAADDRLRAGADDPAWLLVAALGQVGQLLHRHREEMESAGRAAREAAQAEIQRVQAEASGAIAEALAAGQQAIAEAAAREVAAMETSARTAVGQVVEDLRRRATEAIEEVRRASPAHRSLWSRLWPAALALALGVGSIVTGQLLSRPPATAVLIGDEQGNVWWAPQHQVLARGKEGGRYARVYPAGLSGLVKSETKER